MLIYLICMYKKLLTNFWVFATAFIIVSITADLYYHNRVTQKGENEKGQICYSDFRVLWLAASDIRHQIIKDPKANPDPKFKHFWFLDPPRMVAHMRPWVGPGDEHIVYRKDQELYHFRYSPFIAFIMIPIGKVTSPADALIVWYCLLNIVFFMSLLVLGKQLTIDFDLSREQGTIVLWAAFLMSLRFYLINLSLGQSDIFIAAFFVLFLMAYLRHRDILCGILLAIIFQMKPFFVPILFYLLLIGRIKIILSTLIVFAASLLVPAYMLGMEKTIQLARDWFSVLNFSIPSQILSLKNHSFIYFVGSTILKMSGLKDAFQAAPLVFYLLSAGFIASSYILLRAVRGFWMDLGNKRFTYLEVSLIIMTALLFSPITWEAHFITLIIPIGYVICLTINCTKKKMPIFTMGIFFILSSLGKDILKIVPLLSYLLHPTSLAVGTISLALSIFYAYRENVKCSKLY